MVGDVTEKVPPEFDSLATAIRAAFPVDPVPPYPPEMGLDPMGVDEYSGFAHQRWTAVEPKLLAWNTYDISPAIGFAMHEPPHMWNYHVPGFMVGALLHESEIDIVDGFVWHLREMEPVADSPVASDRPWWHGSRPFENYSTAQRGCVTRFLRLLRDQGSAPPLGYIWESADQKMLQRWEACSKRRDTP